MPRSRHTSVSSSDTDYSGSEPGEVSDHSGQDSARSGSESQSDSSESASHAQGSRSSKAVNVPPSADGLASDDVPLEEGEVREPFAIPSVAVDQPKVPEVAVSPLELVSPHLQRGAQPTMDVGELGLDRWKVARDTHVKNNDSVFKANVINETKQQMFEPRRLGSGLNSCLSQERRATEWMLHSFEKMAQSAIMAPVSYFDAAAQKRAKIEEYRKDGKAIPEELRKLEFDTESFCNDMDATITIQGGLVNRLQYRRADNILGGIHHSIRPESTIEALAKNDDVGRRDKAYLFGHGRSVRWAYAEKKRRLSRTMKKKPFKNERSWNQNQQSYQSTNQKQNHSTRIPVAVADQVGSVDEGKIPDATTRVRQPRSGHTSDSQENPPTRSKSSSKNAYPKVHDNQRAKFHQESHFTGCCATGNFKLASSNQSNGTTAVGESNSNIVPQGSSVSLQEAVFDRSLAAIPEETDISSEL